MKKYIIKESQYKSLIELKKNRILAEEIINKISRVHKSLNESVIINEAITDIVNSYKRKGLINETIIKILIYSNKLNESDLNKIKL